MLRPEIMKILCKDLKKRPHKIQLADDFKTTGSRTTGTMVVGGFTFQYFITKEVLIKTNTQWGFDYEEPGKITVGYICDASDFLKKWEGA